MTLKAARYRIASLSVLLIIQFTLGGQLPTWKLIVDLIVIEAFVLWCCSRK